MPAFLDEETRDAWGLFSMLSRRRSYGMGGAQPIAVVDIAAALHLRQITDPDDRRRLVDLVERLDDAWLVHQGKKRKDRAADAAPPPGKIREKRRGANG